MGVGWERCKTFALVSATVFALTFLGLFTWQLYSKSGECQGEFQAQLQNQTTQAEAQLKMCTEALKKDRDLAKKESDDLHAQLINLQENITSQNKEISNEREEIHKLQEEIKQLRQQISKWENRKEWEQSKSSGVNIHGLGGTLLLPLLALVLL
ncbi:hypothetical protein lerEdw1_008501 [Lerista edwardsae]|nr:hypothetical protein lerEdw1_008501 [Lerista edwardsae]